MAEVDGHPTWKTMKRLPRKLFRALGGLRDLHVQEAWVKRLGSAEDPLRARLITVLQDRQVGSHHQVRRALRTFDDQGWKRVARTGPARARLVPPNGLTAQCLALERYEELRRLHARALRTDAPTPWHALRVGLKRFRYAVATLLPERSAWWDEHFGQVQGLLGDIHDLDVLRSLITQESDGIEAASAEPLRHALVTRRRAGLEQYRQAMCGEGSLLREWRAGLPHGKAVAAATAARLRTTARAMDRHPRRTAAISDLALLLFDGLATSGAKRFFHREDTSRTILQAAAELHAIRVGGRQTGRHKAARDFLRAVPVPPGWKAQEWHLVTMVVRYHRGAEPTTRHAQFARLSAGQRDRVCSLAGVLRVARSLHRCGVATAGDVRVDGTDACVRLHVSGMKDTQDNAAHLASAKHLLEQSLKRLLMIESAEGVSSPPAVRPTYRSPGSRAKVAGGRVAPRLSRV
jgi:CHAD domain-containing protein